MALFGESDKLLVLYFRNTFEIKIVLKACVIFTKCASTFMSTITACVSSCMTGNESKISHGISQPSPCAGFLFRASLTGGRWKNSVAKIE